jgi:hypothetical protein
MHGSRRPFVTLVVGVVAVLASAGVVRADERVQSEASAAKETTLRAVHRPALAGSSGGIGNRGPGCPIVSTTRYQAPRPGFASDLDFDNVQPGQQVTLQQGMVQGEIAAVSFQIPDSEFPIKMELIQAIFGSVATQQTTTRYTIFLWDGEPGSSGLISASSDSTDPASPPDLVLPGSPGGTQAAVGNILFSVDSQGDPNEDWVIPALGTPTAMHTVSIGIRIDHHNSQAGDGCGLGALPANANAFPCTEPATCCSGTNLLTFPNDNWLFIQACPGGCPAGWKKFSQLAAGSCLFGQCIGCRPAGDWALRFKYSSQVCLPDPTGSCCAASGACTVTTQAACVGTWTNGATCSPNPCAQPTGACCTSGVCSTTTQAQCTGTFQGAGTTCGGVTCPQPTGACCFSASSCQILDSATCTGFGGTYIGNSVACGASAVCPLGACCLPTGVCVAGQSQPQCTGQGGTFQGVSSSCTPNNCPQPTGACCNLSSGFCGLLTQASCASIQNTAWQGPLTTCTPTNPCTQTGACCNGTACTVTASTACGGQFQGANSVCGQTGNPTTCCPANFNQVGGVTVQDVFDFLAAYFSANPAADFNQVGGVTVQDIFDFLGAYFANCV